MIKMSFKGQKAMTRNIMSMTSNFQNGLAVAFLDIGKVLVDDFHRQTQKKKSGRVYNYKGRKIRASAFLMALILKELLMHCFMSISFQQSTSLQKHGFCLKASDTKFFRLKI